MKKKKRRVRRWVLLVFIIVFLVLLIFSLLKIFVWTKNSNDTKKITTEITKITDIIEIEDTENTELVNKAPEKESDYWYYIKFPLINVDINELKKKNNDTVGWINLNNSNINYPIVKTTNNEFYLNHSYDKSYNIAGWVFMDYRNKSNFENKNTIIYAHDRKDKTLFGSLNDTLNPSWYTNKDNFIIRTASENGSQSWQIFSIYKIPVESYYITTDFYSDGEYEEFLNTLKNRSVHNFDTDVNKDDFILTLSTCYSDNVRTVVHAKLIKKVVN